MRAHLADENISYRKFHHDNQAVVIPPYVEHVVLVAHI